MKMSREREKEETETKCQSPNGCQAFCSLPAELKHHVGDHVHRSNCCFSSACQFVYLNIT